MVSSNIKPFRFWVQSVLPLVYDDSLSYYEVLCKVVARLNEIVSHLSEIDDSIKQEVIEYINSDEGREIIESIVSEYIPDEDIMNFSSKTIDMNRIISDIRLNNPTNPGSYYCVGQSICYNSVNNSLIVFYVPNVDVFQRIGKIVEYSLDTKTVIREQLTNCGHANGCSFNPEKNEIYVCPMVDETVGETTGPVLTVIDYDTLDVKQFIPFISTPVGVAYFDNFIYVRLEGNQIFVLNDDYEAVRAFDLVGPDYKGSVEQDIEIHDKYVYALNWRPNTINVYDMSGENVANYNVPEWWNKYYRIHECEGIAYLGDDNFAVMAISALGGSGYQMVCNIGVTSFKFGMIDDEAGFARIDLGAGSGSPAHIYVDNGYTGLSRNGTQEAPFKNAQEAIESLHSPWFDRYALIHLLNNGHEDYTLDLRGLSKPFAFQGAYTFTKGVYAYYTSDVTFTSDQTIQGNGVQYSITANDCRMSIGAAVQEGSVGGLSCINCDVLVSSDNSFKISANASKLQLNQGFDTTKVIVNDGVTTLNRPVKVFGEITNTDVFTPSTYLARFNRLMLKFKTRNGDRSYSAFCDTPKIGDSAAFSFYIRESSFIGIIAIRLALYGSGNCQFTQIVKTSIGSTIEDTNGFPTDFICEGVYGIA